VVVAEVAEVRGEGALVDGAEDEMGMVRIRMEGREEAVVDVELVRDDGVLAGIPANEVDATGARLAGRAAAVACYFCSACSSLLTNSLAPASLRLSTRSSLSSCLPSSN
jgi:hypothetical protein